MLSAKILTYRKVMRLLLLVLISSALFATTLYRVASGSQGGTDSAGNVWLADQNFTGGSVWVNGGVQIAPYKNLRFATSFTYNFPVAIGNYEVTLKFIEPNQTSAGKRVFNVFINDTQVIAGLDLADKVGLLIPYDVKLNLGTALPNLKIDLKGLIGKGNAVISGIQIDSVGTTATSSCLLCYSGTINRTDLTSTDFEQEIPIFYHMPGDFLYFKVSFELVSRFLGHTTLQGSMGRPGTNHDELIGAYFDLTSPDGYFWQATPGSPQLHDFYDIVVYLKSTGTPIINTTTGQLNWKICGFRSEIL